MRHVEILDFKHFAPYCVFKGEDGKWRNKEVKNYVDVSVVIEPVCGNTKE